MDQGFFSIRDHRDMLAKAERELTRMEADRNVDSIFNFFVTAYHVMDYVKVTAVPRAAVNEMYADLDFEMCKFISNKAKHLELRVEDKEARSTRDGISILNIGSVVSPPLARRPSKFFVDGREVNLLEIGRELIVKWKNFFNLNGI